MSQKGISFRLNSHVTAFAILIISAVVFINYHYSKKILTGKIEDGAINQSNLVISRISRLTIGTEEIARNVSHQALYFYKHNDLNFFIDQVLTTNKTLESIHVELFDGDQSCYSVCHSPTHCSKRCNEDNQIFPDTTDTKNLSVWSAPFYCGNDTTHLLVAYRTPIYYPNSTKMAGMVYCELSLRKMREMLGDIQIGEQGYAFIIDKKGDFITHPKEEWVIQKNLFERSSLIFPDDPEKIEALIRSGGKGAGYGLSEYLDNQTSWFYFAPLSNSQWTVIIVIPEKELFKEFDYLFQIIVLVSCLGILVLVIMNMLIFKRILDPLARIAQAIQRFSAIPGKEQHSKDEVKILKDSLEHWQARYGHFITEQKKTATEKLKYEKDMNSAREIQLSILPSVNTRFADHPEIDLFAILMPAETVGGDLYDYFFIDDEHLLIAIGDVSGKGIPASLFMAVASTLIKTNANVISSRELVAKVNEELSDRNSNQYFLTLFIAILNVRTGVMDYCNAAHNYPYVLKRDGSFTVLSQSHGLPLGIYKDKSYESSSYQLSEGDSLVLYTDGVINSTDSHDHYYGIDRLEKNLKHLNNSTCEEIVNKLLRSIVIFEAGNTQSDDITLLAVRYLAKNKNQD